MVLLLVPVQEIRNKQTKAMVLRTRRRSRLSATEHIFDTRTQSYWSFTAVIVIPTGHVLIRAVSNGEQELLYHL